LGDCGTDFLERDTRRRIDCVCIKPENGAGSGSVSSEMHNSKVERDVRRPTKGSSKSFEDSLARRVLSSQEHAIVGAATARLIPVSTDGPQRSGVLGGEWQ
jgi:hypothetical protein